MYTSKINLDDMPVKIEFMYIAINQKTIFFPVIPPFFEADYLEIVKDLPDISLGPSSGYEYYRKLSLYGPNSFPVLTDHDGYAYIVAGNFGKVGQFHDSSLITIFLKYLS